MKYYLKMINEILEMGNFLKIIEKFENKYWIDQKFDLLEIYFNAKIGGNFGDIWNYYTGNKESLFFNTENEMKAYFFRSLINYLKNESEFLKNEVSEFENLKNWNQQ